MAVVAERHQVVQVVGASIMQMVEVVDLDTPQALALAVLASVAVPGEHSTA